MTDIEALNSLVPGWSEIPNGMMTNPDIEGGIIDSAFVSGEWFVIFNDNRPVLDCFATRADAVAAFVTAFQAAQRPVSN